MSVTDVADALFLHPNKIEALESDTFDRLAPPTFVRGYLRGYARVLGLPSKPILEMYDRQGFEPPPLAPGGSETKQAHTSDPPVRLVTYAVGAVLVLLVGLWWKSQGGTGFDIGGDLSGWWFDLATEPSLPDAEAPAPASDGNEAGADSIATAPDRIDGPSQGGGPPMPYPLEGPETAGIPADATVPDGSDTGGQSLAAAPTPSSEASRDDELPRLPPAEGPATAGIPSGATVPDGGDASGRGAVAVTPNRAGEPSQGRDRLAFSLAGSPTTAGIALDTPAPDGGDAVAGAIVMAPDQAGGSPQGGEPPALPSAEGPGTAGTGPDPDEGAGPEAMTGRMASTMPGSGPDVAADPAAEADPGGAGRPEAPAPRETRPADATDGSDTTAAPETVTPPSVSETSPPSGTAPAPPDVDTGATAVAGAAQPGLVLAFVHESWLEVFDRERTRLFFGLVQPGQVLDFEGPQPFDVLLGNSKDVRVEIDGEAFDHTPYIRHGVARFSVGAAPAGSTDSAEPPDTAATGPTDPPEMPPQPGDDDSR